jgi:hypothetical protein
LLFQIDASVLVDVGEREPSVARLTSLWSDEAGEMWAEVEWFYRHHELATGAPHTSYASGSHRGFEVFKTSHRDDIPVESIVGRCYLLDYHAFCRLPMSARSGDDIYFCSYGYDAETHAFAPSLILMCMLEDSWYAYQHPQSNIKIRCGVEVARLAQSVTTDLLLDISTDSSFLGSLMRLWSEVDAKVRDSSFLAQTKHLGVLIKSFIQNNALEAKKLQSSQYHLYRAWVGLESFLNCLKMCGGRAAFISFIAAWAGGTCGSASGCGCNSSLCAELSDNPNPLLVLFLWVNNGTPE